VVTVTIEVRVVGSRVLRCKSATGRGLLRPPIAVVEAAAEAIAAPFLRAVPVRVVDKDVRPRAGDKTAAVATLAPPVEQAAVADKVAPGAGAKVAARK